MSGRASRRGGNDSTYSVFLGRLPVSVTKGMLFQLFKQFGDIIDVHINHDLGGMSYTYGFVRFKSMVAAETAVKEMNGWPVEGVNIRVEMSDQTRKNLKGKVSAQEENCSQAVRNLTTLLDVMNSVAQATEEEGVNRFWPEDMLTDLKNTATPKAPDFICKGSSWSPEPELFFIEDEES